MEIGENRLQAAKSRLRLASNPAVAVKTGMMLAGTTRFGWLFDTCMMDG
jgi:hypothetical protein